MTVNDGDPDLSFSTTLAAPALLALNKIISHNNFMSVRADI